MMPFFMFKPSAENSDITGESLFWSPKGPDGTPPLKLLPKTQKRQLAFPRSTKIDYVKTTASSPVALLNINAHFS